MRNHSTAEESLHESPGRGWEIELWKAARTREPPSWRLTSALISSNDASIENDWLTPVATRATEKRDLLAVINDNIADFSPAAERKRTLGTHELLKVGDGDGDGDGGIRLPLALHKEWSRNKFESPYGAICKHDLDFLTEMVCIITRPGELDHHQLVHWQKELNRYW